ncbi:single-stranded DNA-binding protein [Acidipila sp. EB88]|uniref:single-stranded DNA-binding protein n=1 Tax=Acidipila sp. EB88 TaxID=2305226 RepID=UPI000F5E74E7|nr:single-stranded DNA-binding protein [Acidipila sp. EB88]RRA47303.1 single-stranded DNA-binding protein [Acidipila sp. EB88]
MAKTVNKVILLGNLGKDPEVKFLPSGQAVANFGIATTDRIKDKASDAWTDRTEWHNVTAYGRTAEIVRDYVKKGNKLYIEGRLTTRSWDDKETGKKVYRTEIVVNELVLLSGRGEGDAPGAASTGYGRNAQSNTASFDQRSSAPQDDYAHAEITDDDIPF